MTCNRLYHRGGRYRQVSLYNNTTPCVNLSYNIFNTRLVDHEIFGKIENERDWKICEENSTSRRWFHFQLDICQ